MSQPPPKAPPWPLHLPPGKGVKFSVSDSVSGLHSSTWLVKTSKNHDDVYLAEITSSGVWKTSHHNDGGIWRIAMTEEGSVQLGVERQIASEWPRPIGEDGWTEGVAILVPKKYLGPRFPQLKDDVVLVPMSKSHNGIVTRLFFEDANALLAAFPAAFPIAVLDRVRDGRVYLIAEPVSIEESQLEELDAMCAEARHLIPEEQLRERNRFIGVRVMDERRVVIDLSVAFD